MAAVPARPAMPGRVTGTWRVVGSRGPARTRREPTAGWRRGHRRPPASARVRRRAGAFVGRRPEGRKRTRPWAFSPGPAFREARRWRACYRFTSAEPNPVLAHSHNPRTYAVAIRSLRMSCGSASKLVRRMPSAPPDRTCHSRSSMSGSNTGCRSQCRKPFRLGQPEQACS